MFVSQDFAPVNLESVIAAPATSDILIKMTLISRKPKTATVNRQISSTVEPL